MRVLPGLQGTLGVNWRRGFAGRGRVGMTEVEDWAVSKLELEIDSQARIWPRPEPKRERQLDRLDRGWPVFVGWGFRQEVEDPS